MTGPDDRALVTALARRRDARAFEVLYARHTAAMYGLALRLTAGREADAEDVVHDAWVRAVERMEQFEGRSTLRSWLCGFVVFRSRELRRAQGRQPVIAPEHTAVPVLDHVLEWTPERLDLQRVVHQLANGYREVLILHDVEGFTHEEIAATLDIEVGTSKSQLARARAAVRRALGGPVERSTDEPA